MEKRRNQSLVGLTPGNKFFLEYSRKKVWRSLDPFFINWEELQQLWKQVCRNWLPNYELRSNVFATSQKIFAKKSETVFESWQNEQNTLHKHRLKRAISNHIGKGHLPRAPIFREPKKTLIFLKNCILDNFKGHSKGKESCY